MYMVKIRRHLHKYPELSRNEFETQKYIMEQLDKLGIRNYKIATTGVIGEIGSGSKCIGFRADMDGLPIEEVSDKKYKSKNIGVSHSCGHDVHMAALLGLAKRIKEKEIKLKCCVRFIFQPDEEDEGGAKRIIEEGGIEDVTYLFGGHVNPTLEVGVVCYRHKEMNGSSDMIRIEVSGLSSHGAYPEDGKDSIVIMSSLIMIIQTIVSRNISPLNSGVITFGTICGGEVYNQVSNSVVVTGTIRSLSEKIRKKIIKRIIEICDGIEKLYNIEVNCEIKKGYDSLVNSNISYDIENMLRRKYDSKKILYKEHPSLGVEDFSYYCKKTDCFFVQFGCKIEREPKFLHNNSFDVNENVLEEMVNYYMNCLETFGGI